MNTKKYHIIINDFSAKLIGVQVSAIQRANLFCNELNLDIEFITTKLNLNFYQNYLKYSSIYNINQNIKAKNMYFDLLDLNIDESKKNISIDVKSYAYSTPKSIYREDYFDLQHQCKMHVYYKNGRSINNELIDFINYFDKDVLIQRDRFLANGHLMTSAYFDYNGALIYEEFFDNYGRARIVKNYSNNTLKNIFLNDSQGLLSEIFKSEKQMVTWWYKNKIAMQESIFIIDGGPHHIDPLKALSNIKIISVLHSNHIQYGHSPINGPFNSLERKKLLENPSSVDACVILTKEQLLDIETRFPEHCKLFHIPHPIYPSTHIQNSISRDPNKIVIIARLVKEKNIADAIYIMQIIKESLPSKKLYIYGDGDQRQNLLKLIQELQLEDTVFLMGYCHEISSALNTSSLFLMTSLYESFALSIIESLSHGVPVLSFDINYGPRSLIKDRMNGFLIENRNTQLAAEQIISYFTNPELIHSMIKNAYKSVEWLAPQNIAKKWELLFNSI